MRVKSTSDNRHHKLRQAYRRDIGEIGMFIEGTFSQVLRQGRKQPSWQLTFKQDGKTRTVYVPVALVPEVTLWVEEFKRLKTLIHKVSMQNLSIIRDHGAVRRAENRARLLSANDSASTCAESSDSVSRS